MERIHGALYKVFVGVEFKVGTVKKDFGMNIPGVPFCWEKVGVAE